MNLLNFNPDSGRINAAYKRLKSAYERNGHQRVPVVEPAVEADLLTTRQTLTDMELMLVKAVRWANNLAATDNDWPPVILGYCGVVMVAEAFGCEVVFTPGESPWAKHAVNNISNVWHLKPAAPLETPTIRRQFEWTDYAQRMLGTQVPMWTLDIQSPFSVAAQIVEPNELMTACITNPKAVHHVCNMITEYSIDMMESLLRKTERPGYPGANFPCICENIGLCLADDTPLIMLSPAMYEEFALPYNCRIAEAFGGMHVHSCGDYRHNLDNVLRIANVRSIQLHAGPGEFPLPENAQQDGPFNRARKHLTCFVDVNDVARGDKYKGRYREHYQEYVLPRICSGDMKEFIIQSCGCPQGDGLDRVNEQLKWTRTQLHQILSEPAGQ